MLPDESKAFFFKKKKQKTFGPFALPAVRQDGDHTYFNERRFWFFFSKKNIAKLCFV